MGEVTGKSAASVNPAREKASVEHGISVEPADPAERLQQRLAVPVLFAALASVPGVFLTLFDDPARTTGVVINALSGAVIVAEVVVLFAVSDRKWQWLRRNRRLVWLAALIAPAAMFAAGPVQLLRLVKLVGALRIVRVGRILKAGRIMRERAGLNARWQRAISFAVSLLVATFVVLVLSDPTSHTRRLLDDAVTWLGVAGALMAGTVLAVATYVVRVHLPQRAPGRDLGVKRSGHREPL